MEGSSDEENNDVAGYQTPPTETDHETKHRDLKYYRIEWERNTVDLGKDVGVWLCPDPISTAKARCKVCNISFAADITLLKDHKNSRRHIDEKVKLIEGDLSNLVAKHNMSLDAITGLIPIIKFHHPDPQTGQSIQLERIVSNATRASKEKAKLIKKLRKEKFSILIDNSTRTSRFCHYVGVRFYDETAGHIVSKLFSLDVIDHDDLEDDDDDDEQSKSSSAKRMYHLIIHSLQTNHIPFDNLVGFGSDEASSMIGSGNSLLSRLEAKCPGLIGVRCICDSLNLATNEAFSCLPRSCEEMPKNIYNILLNSKKIKSPENLVAFQDFLEKHIDKILKTDFTRWLWYRDLVRNVLEVWPALQLYFLKEIMTTKSAAVESVHAFLTDPLMKAYYLFLDWILPKVTSLYELFQSSQVLLPSVHDKMVDEFKVLLVTYMKFSYVGRSDLSTIKIDNESEFQLLENLYLGVGVLQHLSQETLCSNKAMQEEVMRFRNTCRQFLMSLCKGVQQRYDFGSPLLKAISCLSPSKALSLPERTNTPSLKPLMELVPRAMSSNPECSDTIDDEWRRLPLEILAEDVKNEKEADVFWRKMATVVVDSEEKFKYEALPRFALAVLSIPHSMVHLQSTSVVYDLDIFEETTC